MKQYDEYELIEVDHDEAHVLDMMTATQAEEHWGLEQEQALLRDIERRTNTFYPTKGERQFIACKECNGSGGDMEDDLPCVVCDGAGRVPKGTMNTIERFLFSKKRLKKGITR